MKSTFKLSFAEAVLSFLLAGAVIILCISFTGCAGSRGCQQHHGMSGY